VKIPVRVAFAPLQWSAKLAERLAKRWMFGVISGVSASKRQESITISTMLSRSGGAGQSRGWRG
jgi:hypothetical protein